MARTIVVKTCNPVHHSMIAILFSVVFLCLARSLSIVPVPSFVGWLLNRDRVAIKLLIVVCLLVCNREQYISLCSTVLHRLFKGVVLPSGVWNAASNYQHARWICFTCDAMRVVCSSTYRTPTRKRPWDGCCAQRCNCDYMFTTAAHSTKRSARIAAIVMPGAAYSALRLHTETTRWSRAIDFKAEYQIFYGLQRG